MMVAYRCDAIFGTGDRWSSSSSWGLVDDAEIIHAGGKVGGFVLLTLHHDCDTIVLACWPSPAYYVASRPFFCFVWLCGLLLGIPNVLA